MAMSNFGRFGVRGVGYSGPRFLMSDDVPDPRIPSAWGPLAIAGLALIIVAAVTTKRRR